MCLAVVAQLMASVALVAPLPAAPQLQASAAQLRLPTPIAHYQTYDSEREAAALLRELAAELDPVALGRLMAVIQGARNSARPVSVTADADLAELDLGRWRVPILELLLHRSHVLELIPEDSGDWVPLVHDSLLVVLEGMSEARLYEKIGEQAMLPPDADRGTRLLAFASKTPLFQKLGQILARNEMIDAELRGPLQTLENSIETTRPQELVANIRAELGPEVVERHRIEFEDEMLSEASVGAVIAGTLVPNGAGERARVVFKMIKRYAIDAIREDLESIDRLLLILEDHRDSYGIGAMPLTDMFEELRDSLSREVLAAQEQDNLRRAAAYFAGRSDVLVPAVYPFSTPTVTVMERVDGVKISDAFVGDQRRRSELGKRLADLMIHDVLFAPGEDAIFHGDPHAGNVFFAAAADGTDRIALLDWGLLGVLEKPRRMQLAQVGLGLYLRHDDRLYRNAGALLDRAPESAAEREALRAAVDQLLDEASHEGELELLDRLVAELAQAGFRIDPDILLFVKSLITVRSVIGDLDPEFETGEYVRGRATDQIFKEMPKRLLNTVWVPGFGSHDYPSMASNADVGAVFLNMMGVGLKTFGVGIWRGIKYPFSH